MSILNLKLPEPHKAQQKILKSKAPRIVVNCGRQFGKTSLMLQVCLKEMLHSTYKNNKLPSVLYVTPTNSLGNDVYKEMLALIPEELITEQNITRLFFKLYNGSTFRIISAESGSVAFRGKRHSLSVLDECAHYKGEGLKKIWLEGIQPTMLSYDGGRAYFISTPLGTNYFHELYMKGHNYALGWDSFHFTSYDNPYLSKEYIDSQRLELPQLVFEQEIMSVFASNQNNPFGMHIQKNVIPEISKKKACVYSADLAKHVDFTVIGGLDENAHMCHFDRFQADWNITKQKIMSLPRAVDKIIDSTGVGDPIVEDLIYSGVPNIKPFKFNKQSKQNLMREFIKAVEDGKIKYNQACAEEMNVFQYTYSPRTGHVQYASQAGYHDDIVMMTAMLWWQYNRRTRRSNNWCIGRA